MTSIKEYNGFGEDLERILKLEDSPVAVKMLKSEAEIPADAVNPRKNFNYHLAQCQAIAKVRRERVTLAMLKEDNWCPGPMTAFGLVPPEPNEHYSHNECNQFEYGQYTGILMAPLKTAAFEPEAVVMYLTPWQLTNLFSSLKAEDQTAIDSHYFAPSCVYAVTSAIMSGKYQIVLPDPGEYIRGLSSPGQMIFSIPQPKLAGLVNDLVQYQKEWGFLLMSNPMMYADYPLPPPYRGAFEKWGMHKEG